MATPSGGTISINRGAGTTYLQDVTLTLFCRAADEMRIANGTLTTAGAWEAYASTKAWTLTSGYGVKTVCVDFRVDGGAACVAETAGITYADPDGIVQVGESGIAMDRLWDLITYCPTWRSWTETLSQHESRAFVHRHVLPEPLVRPFVLIQEGPGYSDEWIGTGSRNTYLSSGSFEIVFEDEPKNRVAPIDWATEMLLFKQHVEGVLQEMKTYNGTLEMLNIEGIDQNKPVMICNETRVQNVNEQPDLFMQASYVIKWK